MVTLRRSTTTITSGSCFSFLRDYKKNLRWLSHHMTMLLLLLLPFALISAQDLSVPTTWRKPINSRPLSDRISISQKAIDTITPELNSSTGQFNGIGYWQSGNVWSAMANQDFFAKTTVNKDLVLNNLNIVFKDNLNYDAFGSMMMRCGGQQQQYTLTEPMETRQRSPMPSQHGIISFLFAQSAFLSVITAAQASAGTQPHKNFTIEGTCGGATMAGGVFWRPTANDQAVNSITTGISAFLAESTGHSKYKDAALLSAKWIESHNINADNIVLDTVNSHDCTRSPATWLLTYNSGKYVEGLSVLSDITGDSHWRTLTVNIVAAAVKSSAWQGTDGIITEGSSPSKNNDGVGFKAIFIRGLLEVFSRNPSNVELGILLRSYIDVQYSALLDLAANGTSYSSDWHGPPQAFTTWGQLSALDVLASAIVAND
ncbi:endo-1,6-alpha-mannosidase [Phlegmacium glaucopus]|nr:endo-1,6-alpha-mannosidase [Phlegmacium glaucopus]